MGEQVAHCVLDAGCEDRRKGQQRKFGPSGCEHDNPADVLCLPPCVVAAAWGDPVLTRRHCLGGGGLAVLLSWEVRAVDFSSELAVRLADAPVLRGNFIQTHTLKGFKNPMVSRGDFLLLRSRGVFWRVRTPFASTLLMTRERLLTRGAQGSTTMQIDLRSEPSLRSVNEVMFALLVGDLPVLSRHFRIDGKFLDGQDWRITLTPVDAMLSTQFKQLSLEGDHHVRKVTWDERSGDRTVIQFASLRVAQAATREEEASFESAGS